MTHTVEISLPELLERVRAGKIPLSARARVTYEVGYEEAAAEEEAPVTEEEMEEERQLFNQLEHNINETRRACEMRTL